MDPLKDETRKKHLKEMMDTKMAMNNAKKRGYRTEYKGLQKKLGSLFHQLKVYDSFMGYSETVQIVRPQ